MEDPPSFGIYYDQTTDRTYSIFKGKTAKSFTAVNAKGNPFGIDPSRGSAIAIGSTSGEIFKKAFGRSSREATHQILYNEHGAPVNFVIKDGKVKHNIVLSDISVVPERREFPSNTPIASFDLDADTIKLLIQNHSLFEDSKAMTIAGSPKGGITFILGTNKKDLKQGATSHVTRIHASPDFKGDEFSFCYIPTKSLAETLTVSKLFCDRFSMEVFQKYMRLDMWSKDKNLHATYLLSYQKEISK